MASTIGSTALTTGDIANTSNEQESVNTGRPEDRYSGPLLQRDLSEHMRTRWEEIQTGFVDDPRACVKHADELVAMAVRRLAESFSEERTRLEHQWSAGNEVSTEDLRQAVRRYRAFFYRLLAV